MALTDKLREDLKEALKKQDKTRISVLRLVLASMKNVEIAQRNPLDDNKILEVITREVKRHRESIEAFKNGNRNDLVMQEEAELSILMSYLPEQMSRDEIIALTRKVVDAVGASGPGDRGKVMAQLMPQLKGKADGKEVNEIVVQMLTTI